MRSTREGQERGGGGAEKEDARRENDGRNTPARRHAASELRRNVGCQLRRRDRTNRLVVLSREDSPLELVRLLAAVERGGTVERALQERVGVTEAVQEGLNVGELGNGNEVNVGALCALANVAARKTDGGSAGETTRGAREDALRLHGSVGDDLVGSAGGEELSGPRNNGEEEEKRRTSSGT